MVSDAVVKWSRLEITLNRQVDLDRFALKGMVSEHNVDFLICGRIFEIFEHICYEIIVGGSMNNLYLSLSHENGEFHFLRLSA